MSNKLTPASDISSLSPQDCVTLIQSLVEQICRAKPLERDPCIQALLPVFGYCQPDANGGVNWEVKLCGSNVVAQMHLAKEVALKLSDHLQLAADSKLQ